MSPAKLHFHPGESAQANLVRLCRRLANAAAGQCAAGPMDATGVHEVRLALKFARALLRLSRAAVGRLPQTRGNARLRRAARSLSAERDLHICNLVLRRSAGKLERSRRATARAAVTAWGQRRQRALDRLRTNVGQRAKRAAGELAATARTLRTLSPQATLAATLQSGLKRSRQRLLAALHQAGRRTTAAAVHECRKRCKDLYYQMLALAPAWSGRCARLPRHLRRLQSLLGEHHDLVLARESLSARAGFPAGIRTALRRQLASEQRALEQRMQKKVRRLRRRTAAAPLTRQVSVWLRPA